MVFEKIKKLLPIVLEGFRAAWVYCLLRYVGFEQVKTYPGSWWEWSRDFAAPAEKDVKLLHKVNNPEPDQTILILVR